MGKPSAADGLQRPPRRIAASPAPARIKSGPRYGKLARPGPATSLPDGVPLGLYRATPQGKLLDFNSAFQHMLGYANRAALLALNAVALYVDANDRRQWQAQLEAQGVVRGFETQLRRSDGSTLWVRDGARLLRGEAGAYYEGFLEDITERKQRELELEAIVSVSAALRGAATRAEMLPLILDKVLSLLTAEGASLALTDAATGEIVIELGCGSGAEFTGRRLPPGLGVTGYVIATDQPYVTNDAQHDPRFAWPHLLGNLLAVLCVPLRAQHQTLGALWVGRKTAFQPAEARVLTAIADLAANAIQRVTLHEHTAQNLRRLHVLRAIDTVITSNAELPVTLSRVLEEAHRELGVTAAAILHLSRETQALAYVAGRGFRNPAIETACLQLGAGYAGQSAAASRTVAVTNLNEALPSVAGAELLRAEGFVAYAAAPLISRGRVCGVLEVFHRAPLAFENEWMDFLETLAGQAAIAIDNATMLDELLHMNAELALAYQATIEGWSRALDLRDEDTEGHSERVAEITIQLAHAMQVPQAELVHLYRGALLHDIGKMGVPDNILRKPQALTPEERAVMCRHPEYAYSMLAPIAYLRPALDIPLCHHERWDGAGYPRGLRGEAIPLAARIFAVADVWDAMRSNRPYRQALSQTEALEHIRAQSGSHFDPQVVEAFMGWMAALAEQEEF